jgi:uncharacterized protein involved in type VI secretion and phage assembly
MNGHDASHYFGLYPAIVSDIVDPERLGRVQVSLPWLGGGSGAAGGGTDVRVWATLLSPYADDGQGLQVLPEVGTEVVVGCEGGDARRIYIVGAAWNGRETMPVTPTRPNNKRVFRSRAHSKLEFDDAPGAASVTLSTDRGHKVVLDEGAQQIEITHSGGARIVLAASGQIQITTTATVEVSAASLNVHAATAVFDGSITCTQLTTSVGVVSPSYTPGAGNVW